MHLPGKRALGLIVCLPAALLQAAELDSAFHSMYNSDMPAAHRITNEFIARHPGDPLGYGVRATAYLFGELERLRILESEFFRSDKRLSDDNRPPADPAVRAAFFRAVEEAQAHAKRSLAANGKDKNALFSLALTEGLLTDYLALIEKRQMKGLSHARLSQRYAVEVLKLDPGNLDAYLTTGLSEYILGSLPFFVRWFVKFEQTEGNKKRAAEKLEKASGGRYYGPFARIMLAVIHLREKRPDRARQLLAELTAKYPGNRLLRDELAKINSQLRVAGSPGGAP